MRLGWMFKGRRVGAHGEGDLREGVVVKEARAVMCGIILTSRDEVALGIQGVEVEAGDGVHVVLTEFGFDILANEMCLLNAGHHICAIISCQLMREDLSVRKRYVACLPTGYDKVVGCFCGLRA